ncbi:MAG: CoA-binding protein [Actinomycetota bacterium]
MSVPASEPYAPSDAELRSILRDARTIAVVGLSSKPDRDSCQVGAYLQGMGYRIIPINPNETEVLGERAFSSLDEVPKDVRIDIVDVFRRAEDTPQVAEQTVRAGARALWLQEGIVNDAARRIAEAVGITVIMGLCIRRTVQRLRKEQSLLRPPSGVIERPVGQ